MVTKIASLTFWMVPVIWMFQSNLGLTLLWLGCYLAGAVVYRELSKLSTKDVVVEAVSSRPIIDVKPVSTPEPIRALPPGMPEGKAVRTLWMKQYAKLLEHRDYQEFITNFYLRRGMSIDEIKAKFIKRKVEYIARAHEVEHQIDYPLT